MALETARAMMTRKISLVAGVVPALAALLLIGCEVGVAAPDDEASTPEDIVETASADGETLSDLTVDEIAGSGEIEYSTQALALGSCRSTMHYGPVSYMGGGSARYIHFYAALAGGHSDCRALCNNVSLYLSAVSGTQWVPRFYDIRGYGANADFECHSLKWSTW